MDGPHVICRGPVFGEGPVWCPPRMRGSRRGNAGGHQLAPRATSSRVVAGVRPTGGDQPTPAVVPNGAALAADGGFVVTQNGGIDFSIFEMFGDMPATRLRAVGPAARRARRRRQLPDVRTPCSMPNDLCVAPDGTVFFTDPTAGRRPTRRAGACSRSIPTGALRHRRRRVLGTERHRARHRRRDAHRGRERPPRRGRRLRPPPGRRRTRDVRRRPVGRRLRARRRRSDLHGGRWARGHRLRARRHGGRAGSSARATTR